MLKQDKNVPLPFEKQVALIFIASSGALDNADKTRIAELETKFYALLESQYPQILKTIAETCDLSQESQDNLKEATESFKKTHPEFFGGK